MKITGQTKLTGILGNPVDHSLSPAIQNAAFDSTGLNWIYIPLPAKNDELPVVMSAVKTFFKGINITMPYKQDVIPYLDETSSFASLVGAVNTIKVNQGKLEGYNTDGRGFLTAIQKELDFSPEGKKIAIIGAGGASRSIAMMLALSKASDIVIANRNVAKAESLQKAIVNNIKGVMVDVLSLDGNLPKNISDCDMVINATPLGMKDDEVPFDPGCIRKEQYVADLIYQQETVLLKEAKKAGAKTMSGKVMLLHQGAASFEIWTDMTAPIEVMESALGEALANETT